MLIENYRIASEEEIAICQNTGLAVLYVEMGQEVHVVEGNFQEAVNEGVKEAYAEGYLRKSVVDDPVFARKNTGTNTPAIIYTDIVPGDKIKFMVTPKGFGSENMSALAMIKPADGYIEMSKGREEVKRHDVVGSYERGCKRYENLRIPGSSDFSCSRNTCS